MATNMEEKLIEIVRGLPILYNIKLPGYKDATIKESNWIAVARQLNTTVPEVLRRWTTLRDGFSRQLREERESKFKNEGRKKRRVFQYFEQLMFLKDFIKSRKTGSSKLEISTNANPQPPVPQGQTNATPNNFEIPAEFKTLDNNMDSQLPFPVVNMPDDFDDDDDDDDDYQHVNRDVVFEPRPESLKRCIRESNQNLCSKINPEVSTTPEIQGNTLKEIALNLPEYLKSWKDEILNKMDPPPETENDEVKTFCTYLQLKLKKLSRTDVLKFHLAAAQFFLSVEEKKSKD